MVKTAFDHNLTTTQNATIIFAKVIGRSNPADVSLCSGSAKIATEGPVENANSGSTEKATT